MNVFISGGCKNGKSMEAQRLARTMSDGGRLPMYYLATMKVKDEEDRKRVEKHIADRDGWGFETIEAETDICRCLDDPNVDSRGIFLLDSVTALLENEIFDEKFNFDSKGVDRTCAQLKEFAKRTGNTIFVSDYIQSDAITYSREIEAYREGLARAGKIMARRCDRVIEVVAGIVIDYK